MKKVLSFALVLCMLAAMMVPMGVSAAEPPVATIGELAWYEEYDATKEQDPLHISNTGWDAVKGTPTIDGTYAEDEAWDNAIPLVLNDNTVWGIANTQYGTGRDAIFYMMWDETNLYLLEVNNKFDWSLLTATSIGSGNLWSGGYNGTQFTVSVDGALTDGTAMKIHQINVMPIEKSGTAVASLATGTQYQGSTNVRTRSYTYSVSTAATSGGGGSWVNTTDTITTYFTKTGDAGVVMETKIPWASIGITEVAATETPFIGVSIYHGRNANTLLKPIETKEGVTLTADMRGGYDPICLLNSKDQAQGGADRIFAERTIINRDVDFWVAEGTGVLRTAGEATIEIDTPEKLLGLGYAMEYYDYDANTLGKTFVLTKDMDLNPHFDDWKQYGIDVGASKMYWEALPVNIWYSFDSFYGVFDGQGHTITGIFSPATLTGSKSSTPDWGPFAGRLVAGGVKNIILDDSYISDKDTGGMGGVVGVIYNSMSGNTNDVFLQNIYIGANYTVDCRFETKTSGQSGGILCGTYANTDGAIDVTLENIVFGGSFYGNKAVGGSMSAVLGQWNKSASSTTFTLTANDILVTGKANSLATFDWVSKIKSADSDAARLANVVTTVPAANAGYWVETELGTLPVKVADMMAEYKWQSTAATERDVLDAETKEATGEKYNGYDVRIVAEVAYMDYDAVGFKVKINKTTADGTTTASTNNIDNTEVWESVLAAGSSYTAADINKEYLDGEDNKLFVITLNGLDADATYTIEVTAVYTVGDTVIESAVAQTTTVSAYVAPTPAA